VTVPRWSLLLGALLLKSVSLLADCPLTSREPSAVMLSSPRRLAHQAGLAPARTNNDRITVVFFIFEVIPLQVGSRHPRRAKPIKNRTRRRPGGRFQVRP